MERFDGRELKLFGHDEDTQAAAGPDAMPLGDLLVELFRLQSAGHACRVRVPVVQRNLGRVHHAFNLAQRLTGNRRAALMPPFEPRPLNRLRENFAAYVEKLSGLCRGLPVRASVEDPGLDALLETVEGHASEANEPDLLRILGVLTEGVYIGPRTFHMDLANSCNENCSYCWFHSPHSKDRKDAAQFDQKWKRTHIDYDVACRLIDDLARLGTREDVLLTGKGEPLTHPRCLDIVDYIKAKGLHTTLFTNGMLLTRENLERMARAQLDLVYVSLSAASPEVYEKLHPGHEGSELETVRQNLLHLRQLKEAAGVARPRVVMVDVVNHDNANELAEFAEWSASVGAEFVRYQLIHVQYYNESLKLTAEDIDSVRDGLARAKVVAAERGLRVMENVDYQLETLEPATGAWGRNTLPDEGCMAGWYFSRSWADGTVSFCCSPKPIAKLERSSFARLWEGSQYAFYRGAGKRLQQSKHVKFSDGTRLLNSHCYSCPNYEGLAEARRALKVFGLERWL